ncbi:hypothetical protein EV140_0607 [Microcella alkaliphila]|uniref:Uncharacterized protein n=1 Tax=Microcella alkaliphila TaxID=279828 RepID=A0A4Q7TX90_9MICO|nr:hypothetical protein [Microcella alkaliphila]RZT64362.1 hypothetical protein EV140_0607 [Microcella alkaliphila]
MGFPLDRDDIISALSELIARARDAGVTGVTIEIIGGAALRLGYFDRRTTVDIDARISDEAALAPHVRAIARERGWPDDWLNTKAALFIPAWGEEVEWNTVLDNETCRVAIAPPGALLAMKVKAMERRGNRDAGDVAKLITLLGLRSADEVDDLYGAYFPGDAMSPVAFARVERIFDIGPPEPEPRPEPPFRG